jgi:hypothetical protein
MKISIYLKGKKDPLVYEGNRIDIVDFNLNGVDYKQVRYFRKGISKSELIVSDLISKITK